MALSYCQISKRFPDILLTLVRIFCWLRTLINLLSELVHQLTITASAVLIPDSRL